jgi:predicted XRE-type DNA-binding protein
MSKVHQKGTLATKHADKQHRGANPLSSARTHKLTPKDRLANEIRAEVKARALSPSEASSLVGEPATEMSLLLSGKLWGFSVERLERVLRRLRSGK